MSGQASSLFIETWNFGLENWHCCQKKILTDAVVTWPVLLAETDLEWTKKVRHWRWCGSNQRIGTPSLLHANFKYGRTTLWMSSSRLVNNAIYSSKNLGKQCIFSLTRRALSKQDVYHLALKCIWQSKATDCIHKNLVVSRFPDFNRLKYSTQIKSVSGKLKKCNYLKIHVQCTLCRLSQ